MPYLYVIRHPKTQPDPALPASEWWLNDEGRLQVQHLVAAPFWSRVSAVYTSSQYKAKTVGQAVYVAHAIPHTELPELDEAHRDRWLRVEAYQAAQARFFSNPADPPEPDWESAQQALARFRRGMMRALDATPPTDSLAVVAHATVLTLYLTYLAGEAPTYKYWKSIGFAEVLAVDRAIMRPASGFVAAPFDDLPIDPA